MRGARTLGLALLLVLSARHAAATVTNEQTRARVPRQRMDGSGGWGDATQSHHSTRPAPHRARAYKRATNCRSSATALARDAVVPLSFTVTIALSVSAFADHPGCPETSPSGWEYARLPTLDSVS